jgi:hypothetical protein
MPATKEAATKKRQTNGKGKSSKKKQRSSSEDGSSSDEELSKPAIVQQLEATVKHLNRTVPPSLAKNLKLIKRLDDVLRKQQHKSKVSSFELLVAQTKEDLARESYELLDNQIRKLDSALAKMDAHPNDAIRKRKPASHRKFRKSSGGDAAMNMEVDPNEPIYCICGQVAFGEMIGCDNPDCDKEWFHVQCVGKPDKSSKWYCPDCTKRLQAS